jgi:hypothetical protein
VVDGVIETGQCDFVNDIAGALPSYVIASTYLAVLSGTENGRQPNSTASTPAPPCRG